MARWLWVRWPWRRKICAWARRKTLLWLLWRGVRVPWRLFAWGRVTVDHVTLRRALWRLLVVIRIARLMLLMLRHWLCHRIHASWHTWTITVRLGLRLILCGVDWMATRCRDGILVYVLMVLLVRRVLRTVTISHRWRW